MIDGDPFDEIEQFLANAYEARRNPLDGSQKRSFTFAEMRALYGNQWAEDFKAQFKAFTGIEFDG